MKKVSQDQVAEVLGAVPGTLRKLASERDFWKGEALSRMHREEATKVAAEMHEKGINTELGFPELVADLEKAAGEGKLAAIAQAVSYVGPDMSAKIAALTDRNGTGEGGLSKLEAFIMS